MKNILLNRCLKFKTFTVAILAQEALDLKQPFAALCSPCRELPMAREIAETALTGFELLGEGGFGTVYKAIYHSDGLSYFVATKQLTNSASLQNRESFAEEYAYLTRFQSGPGSDAITKVIGKVCYPDTTLPRMIVLQYYNGGVSTLLLRSTPVRR